MSSPFRTVKLGVIADTHIPDRVKAIPKGILEAFRKAQVERILHAGDASSWRSVKSLEEIAPVTVVQGNRDWFFQMRTPKFVKMNINGVRIVLTHGHRSIPNYLVDKWAYMRKGYLFKRYYDHLSVDYPDADVIVFGHTHHQTTRWVDNRLYFNPGAAYPCKHNQFIPEYGFLTIYPDGTVLTACCRLDTGNQ
jgi:putative phosphoesterase